MIRQLFKNRTRSMRYSESAPQTSYIKWVPREPLMKLIGAKLEGMITRILGVILAALAAQFVLDGLERSLPGLAG